MDRIIKGYCHITSFRNTIICSKTVRECLAGPPGPGRQNYVTQTLSEYTHARHFKILPLSLHHALQELVTSAT